MRPGVAIALALFPGFALADEPSLTEAQHAQLDLLRVELAGQVQLQAYDLLDELVYGWSEQPPFPVETPVVLAGVSVPVGMGSGLEALAENHFAGLLVKNPRTRMVLSHCPQCTALVVHSAKEGTIVARGVDQPQVLEKAGALAGARHAVFLDFEAEGSALVLRARITSLEPALPILYAKTLSTSTSSAALLRSGERLKSAAEARQEYLDALRGRSTVLVPVRMAIRSYAASGGASLASVPFVWLQVGGEVALSQARAWTASLSAGASWLPELYTGWMLQTRVSRLLSGSTTSLVHPDLYAFFGASVISIRGVGAATFLPTTPSVQQLIAAVTDVSDISATQGALQLGLELRVSNRIAVGAFLESMPMLESPQIGEHLDFVLTWQAFGAEVSFCF